MTDREVIAAWIVIVASILAMGYAMAHIIGRKNAGLSCPSGYTLFSAHGTRFCAIAPTKT